MKHYRQLRTTVQRLRRRQQVGNRTAASSLHDTQGAQLAAYEVFSGQISRTAGTYQRCGSARQAWRLADHLASVNGTEMHVWCTNAADAVPGTRFTAEQLVYSVSPYTANVAQIPATPTLENSMPIKQTKPLKRTAAPATQQDPVAEISQQLDWSIYGAMDLVLDLLDASGQQEAVQELMYQAEELEPDYQWTSAPHDLVVRAQDMVGPDVNQFAVDLLQDVNWSSMARATREYFFGPDQQRYPAPNQEYSIKATNQKEGSIMTQKQQVGRRNRRNARPSRNARRRLTARVERARTADDQGNKLDVGRARAARVNGRPSARRPVARRAARFQPSKADRLTNRVASLTRLLRTAERELQATSRQAGQQVGRPAGRRQAGRQPAEQRPVSLRTRRARVQAIRARLDREQQVEPRPSSTTRHRTARPARQRAGSSAASSAGQRPNRRRASRARSEARRQARTAEAPRVIRRKQDGKLYVRQD